MFGVLEIMLLCFCVGVTKLLLLVSHKYWKLINIKKKKFIQNFVYINAHTNL